MTVAGQAARNVAATREDMTMDRALPRKPGSAVLFRAILLGAVALPWVAGAGYACDGKGYSLDVAVGQIATGGGLAVQLDRIKLLDHVPDKYTISVKDGADVLADHVSVAQYDTISLKTRCGTVTIGADRKSMFHHSVLTVNWSYF
jgi:hypothetical protein